MEISNKTIETFVVIGLVLFTLVAAAWIIFAPKPDMEIIEETTINFEVEVTVRNTGNAPALNIPLRLALPVNHSPAQYVEKIEIPERPERRTEDLLGNEFVHYTVERLEPGSEKNFTFNMLLRLVSVDFNILKNKTDGIEHDENLTLYLLESPYIDVNDLAIKNEARRIARRSKNPADIAWNTYEWVITNINYQQIAGEVDAATTLKVGEGGSAELGNLFVSLMRANGIPARRISGWGHHFKKDEELFLQRFSHGWAEFYLPDYGWVPVDPTFGKTNKLANFAKTDQNHVIMTVGAGIHFLERGSYEKPLGDTEVNTDYKIKVKDIRTENLSVKRDLITAVISITPLLFALFIIYKRLGQR